MSKKKVYFILLILGVLLIGSGIWLLVKSLPGIDIPEGNSVIYEKIEYFMQGRASYLYFYEDGSIIYIEEEGKRFPTPEHPATRTWRTAKFTQPQLDSLLAYLEQSGLDKLDEHYDFPGESVTGGGISTSDMRFTIYVNSENLSKMVTAFGYLTPDKGETYPDMPAPLNEIYGRLKVLTMATVEVYRENMSQ